MVGQLTKTYTKQNCKLFCSMLVPPKNNQIKMCSCLLPCKVDTNPPGGLFANQPAKEKSTSE